MRLRATRAGSPATQLMRAVRLLPPGGLGDRTWRPLAVAESQSRSVLRRAPGCRWFAGRRFGRGSRGSDSVSRSCSQAETRRTESVCRSPRPCREVIEAESRGAAIRVLERTASWAAGKHRRAAPGQKSSRKAPPLRVERARRPSPGQFAEASSGRVEFADESSAASVQAVVLLAWWVRRSEA